MAIVVVIVIIIISIIIHIYIQFIFQVMAKLSENSKLKSSKTEKIQTLEDIKCYPLTFVI